MFKDRKEVGIKLSELLMPYRYEDVIVLAIPRGGVVLAHEIAQSLHAPLDLIFSQKIGHPLNEEYAIGAISEKGFLVGKTLEQINQQWLEEEKKKLLNTIKNRRVFYLKERKPPILTNKIVILVDDGIATGATVKAAILEIKEAHPKKLIVATSVAPKNTADTIKKEVDDFIALLIPAEDQFRAVSAYFEHFPQVQDQEVIDLL